MAKGDEPVKKYSRSSLRVLGTVGEPINPEAWRWYYEVSPALPCPALHFPLHCWSWERVPAGSHCWTCEPAGLSAASEALCTVNTWMLTDCYLRTASCF